MGRIGLLLAGVLCAALACAADKTANPSNYTTIVPTLVAGDTLTLAAGTYTNALAINNLNGSAGAWITIQGPSSGAPAVFVPKAGVNTVEITFSSYVAIAWLTIDGQNTNWAHGISAKNGAGNLVHHIRIENCTVRNHNGDQQIVGISTKTPTWGWTIRKNRILDCGTGLYLGNSTGDEPFVAGIIENNLVQNPIGYCMEIKWQKPRPAVAGMPTGTSSTIIRDNVFIKNDAPSPSGDRPNILVGGFPDSGAGMNDLYEIYGNFIYHNPRESLLQASGRVTIHDNVFVDVTGTAIVLRDHDLSLKFAHVYSNTIYSAGRGIYFGNACDQSDAVVGNLVFSPTPISGAIANNANNLTDSVANAANYVKAPSTTLGAMDFYPLAGACQGAAMDFSAFTTEAGYNTDFNGTSKGSFTFRGAYAGTGVNPGWIPNADFKSGTNSAPAFTSAPTATPSAALVGQAVRFTAAASDPENNTLTYGWDFGDAATGAGSTAMHVYTAAGAYTATVTVSDGRGGTANATVQVTVTADSGGGGSAADSDGDGVSDAQELADGTDPFDPNSAKIVPLTVSKLAGGVRFAATGADTCSVSGVIPGMPAGFDPTGTVLTLNVGGAAVAFTLDAKGKCSGAQGSLQLRLKPSVRNKATRKTTFSGGDVAFKARLVHGTFAAAWADEGVDAAASKTKAPINLRVALQLNGVLYGATLGATYSSKAGVSGKFKK